MTRTLEDVKKIMSDLNRVYQEHDLFTYDLAETSPGVFTYGLHVPCVLTINHAGVVMDYTDETPEGLADRPTPSGTFPSLEAWAWTMTQHSLAFRD